MRKPKILLIPNISGWILSSIASEITNLFKDDFDFYYLTTSIIRRRPDLLTDMLRRVDIVHALDQSCHPYLIEAQQSIELPHPKIITWIHHFTSWSQSHELAAQNSHLLIATTPAWAEKIRAQTSNNVCIEVIHYGVNTDTFAPRRLNKTSPQPNTFHIGFVASKGSNNDGNRKGLDILESILFSLQKEQFDYHISFVGPGWRDYTNSLKEKNIPASSHGFIEDIPTFYSNLDLYLSTSRVEGGPCTVLEAMACETPVVTTNVGIVPYLIKDGTNGIVASPDKFDHLIEGILSIANSKNFAAQLSIKGRETVKDNWQWTYSLKPLKEIYSRYALCKQVNNNEDSHLIFDHPTAEVTKGVKAADAIYWPLVQIKNREQSLLSGFKMFRALIKNKLSLADLFNGSRLLWGSWPRK